MSISSHKAARDQRRGPSDPQSPIFFYLTLIAVIAIVVTEFFL